MISRATSTTYTTILLTILVSFRHVHSFQPLIPHVTTTHIRIHPVSHPKCLYLPSVKVLKNKIHLESKRSEDEEENNEDERTGMNDAFKSLDGLSALDFGDLLEERKPTTTNIQAADDVLKNIKQGSASTSGNCNSDSSGSNSDAEEIKLYKEIYQELESDGEGGIYDNIMDEMTGSSSSSSSSSIGGRSSSDDNTKSASTDRQKVLIDADGIGSLSKEDDETLLTAVEISQDTDEFMKRALEEAISEVQLKEISENKDISLPDNIFNDKEMMKEINAIFDRANEKLMKDIAEIKKEQVGEL